MKFILRPDSSSVVSLRLSFRTGALAEPVPGAAHLCAQLLTQGGTRRRTFPEILEILFPLASDLSVIAGHEMTTFAASMHVDHLDAVYALLRERLLEPAWDPADFERVREDVTNYLAIHLRGENDEDLAKEALYQEVFQGHPYGVHEAGTVSSLAALAPADLALFHESRLLPAPLIAAVGGPAPDWLLRAIETDFSSAAGPLVLPPVPPAPEIAENRAILIEKPARSVAISFGFPVEITRAHSDYAALLLAVSVLGQHRQSSGRLFQSMRQLRGLNYGDYAYLEYFPGGMYTLEPPVNRMRSREIFQVWIRPVERDQAHFALRLALHELERLIRDGLSSEEFERGRNFLIKYTRLLMKTRSQDLGYAIDSEFHGIPPYADFLESALGACTLGQVNDVVRRHLRTDRIVFALAGEGMSELRERLLADAPSPIAYNAPKPESLLAEDAIVARREIPIGSVRTVPAAEMFA